VAKIRDIVVDCEKPSALARFWAAALDDYDIRPYDDEEIERLAGLGLTPETDPGVFVDGPGPDLCFQLVPEGKTTKNRLHLEITAADRLKEVERLLSLGASINQEFEDHTVMQDPEGNEFCIIDEG
jgi:hypothetical protein